MYGLAASLKDTILALRAWESASMSIYHATVITVASDKHDSGDSRNRGSQSGRRWLRVVPDLQVNRSHSRERERERGQQRRRQINSARPGRIVPPEKVAHTRSRASKRAVKDSQGAGVNRRASRGTRSDFRFSRHAAQRSRTGVQESRTGIRRPQNDIQNSSEYTQRGRTPQGLRTVQSPSSSRNVSSSRYARAAGQRTGTTARSTRTLGKITERGGGANRSSSAYRRTPARQGRIYRPSTPAERAMRERRQRLLRRVLMWVLILGIAGGAIGLGVHKINTSLHDIKAATAAPDPTDEYREVGCTPNLLNAQLSQRSTYAGKDVIFSGVLTNSDAKRACHVDAGYEHIYLRLTSGEQIVWDSRTCEVGEKSTLLLIGPKREGHVSAGWNGINAGAECSGTNSAGAGTYHAQLMWDDKPLGDAIRFELEAEPAPQPDSNSDSNTDSASGSTSDSDESPSGSSQEEGSSDSAD